MISVSSRPSCRAIAFVCALMLPFSVSAETQQAVAPAAAPHTDRPTSETAAQTSPAPQAALPKPPPFANRANERLPAWLRVRGEFRERFEGFAGSGFIDGRDDSYWLSRFRFNATVAPSSMLTFQVQAQEARVADKQIGPSGAPFRGTLDVRMAFADVGSPTSRLSARIGRQELVYGDQRLVGHLNWLNTARTFDGARISVRGKQAQLDVFGTSVVRILDNELDKSGFGNRLFGAHATTSALLPRASFEPYVFVKRDRAITSEAGPPAGLASSTAGTRVAGTLPGRVDYTVEMAAQIGSVGSDSIRAWAGHWRIRETLPGARLLRLSGEFNAASGDRDPADGKRGTFDQLYPTGHDKYGLADQVGWRNVRHARGGIELPPIWRLQIGSNYHSWWLMESRDALYNAGGVAIARVAAGAASTHVGQEIDVQAARPLTPQLQLAGGYAHIFPGGFLKEATPGASYSGPYVMVTYIFLADK
jgi:Alginate export